MVTESYAGVKSQRHPLEALLVLTTCESRKRDTFSQGTARQQPLTERQLPKGPAWDAQDFICILISGIQLTARVVSAKYRWPTEGPQVELPRAG